MNSRSALVSFVIGSAALLMLSACPPRTPVRPGPEGSPVWVRFNFISGGAPFNANMNAADGTGHVIRFSQLRFIASDFILSGADETVLADFTGEAMVPGLGLAAGVQSLGRVGDIHPTWVHFKLGLDSVLNHTDPTSVGFPLHAPGLHWHWNPAAGFKFLEIEGHADANGDGDTVDAEDQIFVYHCAMDELLRFDSVAVQPSWVNGTLILDVAVDVDLLLQGIDLVAVPTAMGNAPACAQLMDNLVQAIREQ
ncbi:MAG: MbnP family protein [Flavobacteriales bacterium]